MTLDAKERTLSFMQWTVVDARDGMLDIVWASVTAGLIWIGVDVVRSLF